MRIATVMIAGALAVGSVAGHGRTIATPDEADRVDIDRIRSHIRELSADSYEGRKAATSGGRKTVNYLREQFAASGLHEPPSGYEQTVPLVSRRTRTAAPLRVRHADGELIFTHGDEVVLATGRDHAAAVDVVASGMAFVGYGIVAPEQGWDDYGAIDVTDKVVLILAGEPTGDGSIFRAEYQTEYGTVRYKQEEAARRGARGVLIVHQASTVPYTWEGIVAGSAQPPVDTRRSTPRPDLLGVIDEAPAHRVANAMGTTLDALVQASESSEFAPVVLEAEISTRLEVESSTAETANVIAWLPGTDLGHEYVLFSAHWDHVGTGAPVDEDRVFNGAVDNATGTAVLLELARAFASMEQRPRRSLVFLATTAEELGLLGAYYYADHPIFPLAQTVAAINFDALFPFGEFDAMTVVGMAQSELEQYLATAAEAEGRVLQPDSSPPEAVMYFRSDHYPLARKGVPAVFAVGNPRFDRPVAAEVAARFHDYATRYHQRNDEFDETWDLRGILGDARVFFRLGLNLAAGAPAPEWYPDSEYRNMRTRRD